MEEPKEPLNKRFQLINENAQLEPDFNSFLLEMGLFNAGTKYNLLSIIGSQSSGKSTLLNNLFGTNFDVLNSKQTRQQTTRGIWVSKDSGSNLMVLDVEGSDSKERWDDRNYYEHTTALFALALSHVLIINIWTNEIGRFQASQYGILKVVLEMNIKLFKQESTKKIIFLLRDFSPEDNLQTISDTILEDVKKIWSEIEKPEHFQNVQVSQLFEISIEYLEHIKFARANFDKGILRIRDSLTNPSNPKYYFKNFEYTRNLPVVALPGFIESLWAIIKDHKDINLPAEKIIIANLRCEEIRRSAEKFFKEKLDEFKNRLNINEFGDYGRNLLEKAGQLYDAEAYLYFKEVYTSVRGQMMTSFKEELFTLFMTIYKKAKIELLSQFDKGLQSHIPRTQDQYEKEIKRSVSDCKDLYSNTLEHSKKLIYSLVVDKSHWDSKDASLSVELENEIRRILDTHMKKMLQSYLEYINKSASRKMEKFVAKLLEELDLNIWDKAQRFYDSEGAKIYKEVSSTIRIGFEFNEAEINRSCEGVQNYFYEAIENEFKKKKGDIIKHLMNNFKENFNRDENKQPRNWKAISQDEIERVFVLSKTKASEILSNLKLFKLRKGENDLRSILSTTPGGEGEYIKSSSLFEDDGDSFKLYLNGKDFDNLSIRLMDETDEQFNKALQMHRNEETDKKIGLPFYILLVILGYEEVLYFGSSWFILVPLIILTLAVALVISLGYGSLINNILETTISGLRKKATSAILNAGTSMIKKNN